MTPRERPWIASESSYFLSVHSRRTGLLYVWWVEGVENVRFFSMGYGRSVSRRPFTSCEYTRDATGLEYYGKVIHCMSRLD